MSGSVYSCIADENSDLETIYKKLDDGVRQAQEQGGGRIVSVGNASQPRDFSVDRALKLIASSKTEDLSRHARSLLLSVLPLLEFADDSLELGLESVYRDLRQQLEADANPK